MGMVRLNNTRIMHYFKADMLAASAVVSLHPNSYCLEVGATVAEVAGGKEAGQVLSGPVAANQSITIPMGVLVPTRYHALVEVNPALYAMGAVQCPRFAEPDERTPLVVRLRASVQCTPLELPWIVRIYLLD